MTVVIAEDNELSLRMLVRMFRGLGHASVPAAGARDLARACEGLRPDLVLSDVDLGDGDGIEACLRLRERYPGLLVVIMTADAANVERARDAGFGKILMKPFSRDDLALLL